MNKEEQARYKAILTEHSKLYTENKKLKDKVSYLKERVAYLERSNNRREETILYLREENDELHNKIDKAIKRIELLGKFDGEHCTRNFKMMSADFNYLLKILKDGGVNE